MDWRDGALAAAGVIGSSVAVLHGILVQRLMVRPVAEAFAGRKVAGSIRKLVPLLLHLSTVSWFIGGVALIVAASSWQQPARLATGIFVGALYLYGMVANLWATRGRHPGWMLMAAALALIVYGLGWP